jgi:hypothetical protein
MTLQPFVGPLPLFHILNHFTQSVGLLVRGTIPSQERYLHTGQHKHNNRTQTSMSRVGFKPTTPVFRGRRRFMVHALDRAATAIGIRKFLGTHKNVHRRPYLRLSS